MALQILKGFELGERDCADTMHKQIEAMKLAMMDTAAHVADPRTMRVTVDELLSERYAADRRALIGEEAIMPTAGDPRYHSTVYFCCADGEGNMVSLIQSNFRGFGSGIVIPGTSTKTTRTPSKAASAPTTPSFRASSRRTARPWAPSASWAASCSRRRTCRSS